MILSSLERLKTMRVRVLYFGVLKDLFGCEREELQLPEGALAATLLGLVGERGESGAALAKAVAIAVNREYVPGTAILRDGDEVALLPPVSGGAHAG